MPDVDTFDVTLTAEELRWTLHSLMHPFTGWHEDDPVIGPLVEKLKTLSDEKDSQ